MWGTPSKIKKATHCYYCERQFDTKSSGTLKTKDHIIAVSIGGRDCQNNLLACCSECNYLKGNLHPEMFLQKISKMIEAGEIYKNLTINELIIIKYNIKNLIKKVVLPLGDSLYTKDKIPKKRKKNKLKIQEVIVFRVIDNTTYIPNRTIGEYADFY